MKRTHGNNELNRSHVDTEVVLSGWINSLRDLGGLVFVDLRDRDGITQLTVDPAAQPELMTRVRKLRDESVITVRGIVQARPENMVNAERPTGAIEVLVLDLFIDNLAAPLPFPLDDPAVSEDLRLRYRYLDMRRSGLGRNLRLRHRLTKLARDYADGQGFIEVETPILSKSTPEGARDYLVPSRVHPGAFYALPQAPQQYKQLLMVGGIEKYFQIARCFRDEDLRADRQPEFTQIDMEMSFVDRADVMTVVEGMISHIMSGITGTAPPTPFPRLSYADAMARFGSDKPDTRFGWELVDVTDALATTDFRVFRSVIDGGGVIKGLAGKGLAQAANKRCVDAWTETVKQFGCKGLVTLKVGAGQALEGQVAKFLTAPEQAALCCRLDAAPGDVLLLAADRPAIVNPALGRLRLEIAAAAGCIPDDMNAFVWVLDFPLLEFDPGEQRYTAVHHPFTSPLDADFDKLRTAPETVRAKAYDIVLNGVELGGGSIRIHDASLQRTMFEVLGIATAEADKRFGHLLEAFSYGAPPHGGIALGLDRFAMLLAKAGSIRDVIAFPKTTRAACLLTDSPSPVGPEQLADLGIEIHPEPAD